ncbi:hypothetical protein D3C84_537500 [compost metagenome]
MQCHERKSVWRRKFLEYFDEQECFRRRADLEGIRSPGRRGRLRGDAAGGRAGATWPSHVHERGRAAAHRRLPAGRRAYRCPGPAGLAVRLQVPAEIRRRQPLPRYHQPGRRHPHRHGAGHHPRAGAPWRAPTGADERPLRELDVHRRRHRPRPARAALCRHPRLQGGGAVLLGLRQGPGGDPAALSRGVPRLGHRAWRRLRDLADARPVPRPGGSGQGGRSPAGDLPAL